MAKKKCARSNFQNWGKCQTLSYLYILSGSSKRKHYNLSCGYDLMSGLSVPVNCLLLVLKEIQGLVNYKFWSSNFVTVFNTAVIVFKLPQYIEIIFYTVSLVILTSYFFVMGQLWPLCGIVKHSLHKGSPLRAVKITLVPIPYLSPDSWCCISEGSI